MPSPRDIELFRKNLLKLGKEEFILRERGEGLPIMDPPPEPTPLKPHQPPQKSDVPEEPSTEESEINDFSALLDGLDLENPTDTASADVSELLEDLDVDPETTGSEALEDIPVSPDAATSTEDLDSFLSSDFLSSGSEDFSGEASEPVQDDGLGPIEEMESFEDPAPVPDQGSTEDIPIDSFNLSGFDLPEDAPNPPEETSFAIPDMDSGASMDTSFDANMDFGTTEDLSPAEGDKETDMMEESLGFETQEGSFSEPVSMPGSGENPDTGFSLPDSDFNFGASKLDSSSEDAFADFSLDDDFSKSFEPGNFSEKSIDDQLNVLENTDESAQGGFNLQNVMSEDIGFGDFAEPEAASAVRPVPASGKPGKKKPKSHGPEGKSLEAIPEIEGPIELTEAETERLQDHLLTYPLNLRLAVEEIIAERPVEEKQLNKIIRMLVDGAKPEEMARFAGKIIDKRIEIPKGFHKKTAEEFEREKASFKYAFVHNILPIIKTIALVFLFAGTIAFLGWKFIYIPLKADSLYRAGYTNIDTGKFPEAEELFTQAWETQPVKSWCYRYAEAYVLKKSYIWAEKKYDQLLSWFPFDKKGAMDYANLETNILKFERAEDIVQKHVLEKSQWDNDGILFQGDNRLAWGDNLTDSADFKDNRAEDRKNHLAEAALKYEGARTSYARLIQRYGLKDPYRARMTRYFVRTDNRKEIIANKEYWLGSKKAEIDSLTLSELCGWLIGKGLIEDIKPLLMKARSMDDTLPEVHYEFIRYFQAANEQDEELKSLRNAETMFEYAETSTGLRLIGRRLVKYLDTMNWFGEALAKQGQNLEAETKFLKGIERYERARSDRMLKRDETGRFGKLYANRGDVLYYEYKDGLDRAMDSYDEAERNGYVTKDTNYKRGYIYYRRATASVARDETALLAALLKFKNASVDFRENDRLKYALANTVHLRGDYHLAHGYYLELINDLKDQLLRLEIVEAQTNPKHNELVVKLMKVTNNLGITLVKLGRKSGDTRLRSQGMVYLTESAQMFDALSRDQGTMLRSESKNLAYLNLNGILYPSPRGPDGRFVSNNGIFDPSLGFDLQIFMAIDKKPEGEPGEAGIQFPAPIQ